MVGGISLGPCLKEITGTLGMVLNTNYGLMMISSTHVLASGPEWILNYPISQPGRLDGGICPETFVGNFTGGFIGQPNNIDASIATIDSQNRDALPNFIQQLGETMGSDNAFPFDNVAKYGRTTELTIGVITSNNLTFRVNYPDFGEYTYYRQLRIQTQDPNPFIPFALPGDSGAMIVNEERKVVGMVMSGGESEFGHFTIANQIEDIIRAFESRGIEFL